MNHRIATFICNKISHHLSIDEEMRDVYIYGFELILSFIISTSIILIIGTIFGQVLSSMTFLFVFVLIRRFTGGFHANTYFKCQLFTISFYLISLLLSNISNLNNYYFIGSIIVGISVILAIGPIESPSKPLTSAIKKRNKIIGCIVFSLVNTIGIFILQHKIIANMIFYTNSIILILMLIPYFYKRLMNRNMI